MMPINLIPKERMLTRQRKRTARAWAMALGAYAAIGAVACVVVSIPVNADGPKAQQDLERVVKRMEKAEKDKAQQEKLAAEQRGKLSMARAVGEHPDWSLLLESAARARAGDVALETFELTTTKVEPKPAAGSDDKKPKAKSRTVYVIKLTGHSSAPGAVFGFARRLEEIGVFDQVSVKDTRAATLGSMTTTRFEIGATITEPLAGQEAAR